jgi:hypothetical protein
MFTLSFDFFSFSLRINIASYLN